METILANLAGKVRRESFNGRDYLVAPLTLIVPGVLNGSKGPLYYPPDEVARDPAAWNGMPLVVYHPILPDGSHTSGRDPVIIEKQGLGYVYRSHVTSNGKLAAEGWFDIEHTRRINPGVLSSLQTGKPIELSTGLFTDNYPAPSGATHNAPDGPRPYTFIARNYRPDHVAILPDQTGACSVRDGCGVLVNKDGTTTPLYIPSLNYGHKDCEEYDDWEDRRDCEDETLNTESSFFSRFWAWVTNASRTANAHPNQPRSKVTGRLKALGAGTGKGPAHESAQEGYFGGVKEAKDSEETDEDTEIDEEEEDCSTSNTSTEDTSMALINLDTDLLTNAELGVNKEFATDEERRAAFAAMSDAGGDSGMVSTKQMKAEGGGNLAGHATEGHTGRKGPNSEGMSLESASKGTLPATGGKKGVESHTGRSGPSASEGGGAKSALKAAASEASAHAVARTGAVKKAGTKNKERAARQNRTAWAAHLDAASAHEVAGSHDIAAHHLKAADEHLALAKHHEGGTNNMRLTGEERGAIIGRLVANGCACHTERDALHNLSDRSLWGLFTANAPDGGGGGFKKKGDMSFEGDEGSQDHELGVDDPEDATDQGLDEDMEDEQGNRLPPKQGMPSKGVRYPTGNTRSGQVKPLTANEWMASAPPEIRSAVANAMEIEKQERMKLVQVLVGNVQDLAQRKALAARLFQKSIGELRDLSILVPTAPAQPMYAPQTTVPLFTGAAGGPVGNYDYSGANNSATDDDLLPLPVINWNDGNSGAGNRQRMAVGE